MDNSSEPSDSGDMLGNGGGEPLGCDGTSPETLSPLGVVSDVADDGASEVGLVDTADGVDTGDIDGSRRLDGPSTDEVSGVDPELGPADVGDAWLLPGNDCADVLGKESAGLLPSSEGCELATGLTESAGLPDACESEVGLALDGGWTDSGEPELGGAWLDVVDGALLSTVDDVVDSLGALDGPGLGSDNCEEPDGPLGDAVELAEPPTLLPPSDGADGSVGLVDWSESDCGDGDA